MDSEHGCTRLCGECCRGQSSLEAFGQAHSQSLPDEILIAQCHQHRPSGIYKIFYVAQQTKTMMSVLTEIMSRIDEHCVPRDARGDGPLGG